jgi:ribosomal protein L7/L12
MPNDELADLRAEVERQGKIIDALAKHLGVSQNDLLRMQTNAPPAEVIDALHAGNLIMAIKLWREHTGVGLAEAKQAVEDIQRGLR